ncbi:hypothetical protein D9M68_964870 [compost metagenome]
MSSSPRGYSLLPLAGSSMFASRLKLFHCSPMALLPVAFPAATCAGLRLRLKSIRSPVSSTASAFSILSPPKAIFSNNARSASKLLHTLVPTGVFHFTSATSPSST